MNNTFLKDIQKLKNALTFLFVPKMLNKNEKQLLVTQQIAVVIPTHKPTKTTYKLVESILTWNPYVLIVIVDDCTPYTEKTAPVLDALKGLTEKHANVIFLQTPQNRLKAGALNYGLNYLLELDRKPHIVFTFDDDVQITPTTIPYMVQEMYKDNGTGAVCSQVRVLNKNKNLLTRLQALEYHGFNLTKISDNGFLRGPLVMQGMLTAFRLPVLRQVQGFTEGHLIEDYDITARLKLNGWKVRVTQKAVAWTLVPESLEDFWKQRVRWTFGGLQVLKTFWRKTAVVYQDFIGHAFFLALMSMIIVMSIVGGNHTVNPLLLTTLFAISLCNFGISFVYSVVTMKAYADRDTKDWLIKLAILPEFIYSNMLSLILIGSYLFFVYTHFVSMIMKKTGTLYGSHRWIDTAFQKVGFSTSWGTK